MGALSAPQGLFRHAEFVQPRVQADVAGVARSPAGEFVDLSYLAGYRQLGAGSQQAVAASLGMDVDGITARLRELLP